MTACPSQDYLSRSKLLVNFHLSKVRLLVQGKATCPISKSRLLVRGHFVRGKATCQWLLVRVMAAVNDCLSAMSMTTCQLLSMTTCHYYQWQHLQYGEALVWGHEKVGA